jgi:ferric-dicitrate binding protein FerR (iron transport regulator)
LEKEGYYNVNTNVNVNEINIPKGQTINLTLSDGTKVWLNADTRFTYPSRFSTKNRSVRIAGEGFFEVEHNKDSPFIVQSGDVSTTVLGTKFNVKAYDGERFYITLLEGVVDVSKSSTEEKVRLDGANQQVIVSAKGFLRKRVVDAQMLSQWTAGELYFFYEPLASIAHTLERKFNVTIRIENEQLANTIFNSRIQKDAALIDILNILKETRKLDYVTDGKQIFLKNYSEPF